jgi:inorganic triphosphatase YgiF
MPPLEKEGALLVRAERPGDVLSEIAALTKVGDWTLEPLEPQAIDDVYFDDVRRSLGQRRIALRIRRVDGVVLLTMKSPLGREGGVATRIEIEEPWSPEALREVVAQLDRAWRAPDATAPEAALHELGFAPVQRRRTARDRRAVLDPDGKTLAELALDTVSYDLPTGLVQLCEIEVESRTAEADVRPILAALATRFAALAPWPHGKLATGFAAEHAVREGSLAPGLLTPASLDVLERALD